MGRTPDSCLHHVAPAAGDTSPIVCRLIGQISGIDDLSLCQVHRDACLACCSSLRRPEQINPVIASLIYQLTTGIVARGGHSACSVSRARQLQKRIIDHLSVVSAECPDQSFPPSEVRRTEATLCDPGARAQHFRWATAVLTAPRRSPVIKQTLDSLTSAGFDSLHLFAEPQSWIPEQYSHLRITQRNRTFGNLRNFYSCLCTLLDEHPDADAYAVFQDDIELAVGARAWCEEQLWPDDNGLVSLFTPRLHSGRAMGWQVRSPGFQRVCGAQALVFRRDWLLDFLSDARVLYSFRFREQADDAVLGGWLAREGRGIAYHTPSPVQHTGRVSSIYPGHHDLRNLANAVSSVSEMKTWNPPPPVPGRIGLVGWNTPTGLGSINRDLVRHLNVSHWLAPRHPGISVTQDDVFPGVKRVMDLPTRDDQERWFAETDWLLFAERPYAGYLPDIAAHAGNAIACVPMWEWIRPDLPWLQFVDLMICPTWHAFQLMNDWSQRYGFGWKSVYVPWPVDACRFPFRQRTVCREFLFVNGWGGGHARRPDGSSAGYHRKGLELILSASRLAPDLRFVIRSLQPVESDLPKNVRIAPALRDNTGLYDEGDVCVQPSHYEGLGLQLLECQAAGMPLVTTAGPPMDEAGPWRTIPTSGQEVVDVGGGYISSELMTPESIVETLRPLVGTDIREASRKARTYIETERNWDTARKMILAELIRR